MRFLWIKQICLSDYRNIEQVLIEFTGLSILSRQLCQQTFADICYI